MANVHSWDRFLRLVLGLVALQLGFFWLAPPWSYLAYGVGLILLLTALLRFCPLYRLFGMTGIAKADETRKPMRTALAIAALAALVAGGSYASSFFTRKIFLEDYNAMNGFYKQTLFLTGKAQREEAISNLDQLIPAFKAFTAKYSAYRPYALKGDDRLASDFANVGKIISETEPLVRTGDLHQAHLDLEKIRPIFQDMFKRNGFSMLSVALVDFHDAMETVLEAATAKDAAKIQDLYQGVSDKLKAVEAEANDAEIQAIRAALDDVQATAQAGAADALPGKGDTLKSNFVKVYLKRG
jgi:hypothetical protein